MQARKISLAHILAFAVTTLAATAYAKPEKPMPDETNLYSLKATTLDGKEQPLSAYKGKVALVVNVASRCGFTPQYAGLEKLYEDYKDKGFVILGFPSSDFGDQELATSGEIKTFCSTKYNVTFPMFEKVKTKGVGQSPVYKILTQKGEPQWNFHKYLVDKNGTIVGAFPSKVTPDSAELKQAIEAALAAK
jgi:glutathione peroxidase